MHDYSMKEELKSFGLTENESRVYLALLNNGASPAGKITSKSGIHRRSVYDSIDRLIEKGLVAYIKKNNVKIYEAQNPTVLLELLKKKEDDAAKLMPKLQDIFNAAKEQKETLFFRGKNGVKSIFLDQIREGGEILIIGASKQASQVLKYYLPHYEQERSRKKINTRILFEKNIRKEKLKIPFSQIRYLPDESSGPTATNIYGDKVALIIWSENPYAILIKDKDVADSYRKHFEFMWAHAER